MKADEPLDTIKKLERYYDDVTVARAVASLHGGVFDGWMIRILLDGRGAAQLWPRIEQHLMENLSLSNIAKLADYLPRNNVIVLIDRAKIDDLQLIDQIKGGSFPPIRILPRQRRKLIYERLRKIVRAEASDDHTPALLMFLLDFDERHGADRFANVQLATEWCLRRGSEQRVEQVLSRLLWFRPSKEILQLAEAHLYNFEWTLDTTFILTGLMQATKASQNRKWINRWYDHSEPHDTDGWVISEWIRTTDCSREALASAKSAIRSGCVDCSTLIRGMTKYLHRKCVQRWLDRFIESRIYSPLVRKIIPNVISSSPTSYHCVLAKKAMKASEDEDSDNILLKLIKFTRDPEIIDLARHRVQNFPNAPYSFKLLCAIAKNNPAVAVPWIKEWIEGALPHQVSVGLAAVIGASPTQEHFETVLDWCLKVDHEQLALNERSHARLLGTLLKLDRNDAVVRLASKLLQDATDKTDPAMRWLAWHINERD